METKTEIKEFKGNKVLSINGVGQKGKEYTIMSAGAAKWAQVLKHLKEIEAFVQAVSAIRQAEAAADTTPAPKKAKTPRKAKISFL